MSLHSEPPSPASTTPSSPTPYLSPGRSRSPSGPWRWGRENCDCRAQKIPDTSDELGKVFAKQMKTIDTTKGHTNVAVLLLSWEGTDIRDLDDELNRLEDVLTQTYNYTVGRAVISKDVHSATLETIRLVTSFIALHNSPGSLVLIYYAGHGTRPQDDDFHMARGLADDPDKGSERRKQRNTLVWKEVERVIFMTRSDLLLIFDCCHSGALTQSTPRGVLSERIIECMASCMPNAMARGPGADSFTSALISALQYLPQRRPGGFSVAELMQHIEESEYFKDDNSQIPKLGWRGERPASQRLRLKPLDRTSANTATVEAVPSETDGVLLTQSQHVLHLNLELSEIPSNDTVQELAQEMAELMRSGTVPVMNVSWGFLGTRVETIGLKRWHNAVSILNGERRKSLEVPIIREPVRTSAGSHADAFNAPFECPPPRLLQSSAESHLTSQGIFTSSRQSCLGVGALMTLAFLAGYSFRWPWKGLTH